MTLVSLHTISFRTSFKMVLISVLKILVLTACTQNTDLVKSEQFIDSMDAPSIEDIVPAGDSAGIYFSENNEKVRSGQGQQIGDLFVDWDEQLSQDEAGEKIMGSNGITYICKSGNDRFRITVLDLSEPLGEAGESQRTIFSNGFFRTYKNNLNQMGIPFEETLFNGVNALEYTLSEPEKSAKSMFFIFGNNCYTLQVTAKNRVTQKFNRFAAAINF